MEISIVQFGDKSYKLANGMYYFIETPDSLIRWMEYARKHRIRVKVQVGNVETGVAWAEEYDIMGYIGNTTGPLKSPILVFNKRSWGGYLISTGVVLKLSTSDGKRVFWKADNYKQPLVEIRETGDTQYPFSTFYNTELHGRHNNYRSAVICRNKLL
jgi:hypothetical protein